jgi:hypothetical protein
MLEGWKAYALPAVAAVLLLAFFAYRCSMSTEDTPAATGPAAETKAPPAKTLREQIEDAVADAGASAPPLPDGYRDAVAEALQPLVARCRTPRPDDAAIALALHVEVAAAEGNGGVVREIEIRGVGKEPSEGFVACIEEGARALALSDAAATGVGIYELDAPP